jgi:hypothetical protein
MSSVAERLTDAQHALLNLLHAIEEIPLEDLDALGESLLAVEELRGELATVRDAAEHRLVDAMGDLPELSISGATLEVRRSDSRKAWAHKDIATEVAQRIVQTNVDFETGEMLRSTEDLITDVLNYAGVSYWKVKALNTIGISADDYCEVTEGPMKIRIHRV